MFTIRLELHHPNMPILKAFVKEAAEYRVYQKPDGTYDIAIPNENNVELHHDCFSRAYIMNSAGATIETLRNDMFAVKASYFDDVCQCDPSIQ